MKELDPYLKLENKVNIELNIKKQQESKHTLQGEISLQRGHYIWELNEETGEIKKANFRSNTTIAFSAKLISEKLIIKSGCIYIPALNSENAKRKYLKNKEQSAYYIKPAAMSLSKIFNKTK